MLDEYFNICKILTFSKNDFDILSLEFRNTFVKILFDSKNINATKEPCMIIGWKNAKHINPKQDIQKKKLSDNVYWTYDEVEDKTKMLADVKSFIADSLKIFLPEQYISYDKIIDGDLNAFIKKNIDESKPVFMYFMGKACYLYNSQKNIGLNLESIRYSGGDVRKTIEDLTNKFKCIILGYNNIKQYVNVQNTSEIITIENILWTRHGEEKTESDLINIFADLNSKKHIPFIMSFVYANGLNEEEEKSCLRQYRKDIISDWLSNRELFFDNKFSNNKLIFELHKNKKSSKVKYSNKRTITGRINCVEKSFNPQMLPKDSKDREFIVSRFDNGSIAVFDYVSFETKIALYLSKNNEFIDKYKFSDLHEETAKTIFKKNVVNAEERKIGKNTNHAIVYGGGDEKLMEILSAVNNPKEALKNAKNFLKPIIDTSQKIYNMYDELGYVVNSFGTIVRPNKNWGAFSNFISSTASEITVEKLFEIKEFLSKRQSKFLFQVYDSFVFDIHPEELQSIDEFKNMISIFKNIPFQVECRIGKNLMECS